MRPFTPDGLLLFYCAALCSFACRNADGKVAVALTGRNVSSTSSRCPPQPVIRRPPLAEGVKKLLPLSLVRAVRERDLANLKALVTSGNVLLRDATNNTLAHLAARTGNVEMLCLLVGKEKALVESRGEYDHTPLLTAAVTGKTKVVEFLLEESGADPNARAEYQLRNERKVNNYDALLIAANHGYLDIVKLLLAHGANISTVDDDWATPLHLAANTGHLEVVRYLAEWCPQRNCSAHYRLFLRDNTRSMVIHTAAINRGSSIVQYLARLDRRQLAAHGPFNATVLHIAAIKEDVATLRELLTYPQQDLDLEALGNYSLDPNGTAPSVTALVVAAGHDHKQIVRMLLEAGANDSAADWMGNAAIHRAVSAGHRAVVELLLDTNPYSVNVIGAHSATPLHMAVSNQHYELVRLLLKRGANISASATYADVFHTSVAWTPLLLASTTGNLPILRALLDSGARMDLPDGQGGALPVHLAAQYGHIALAEELLARDKCQLEWTGRFVETPLGSAIRAGQTEMEKWLLRMGANTEAKSRYPNDGTIHRDGPSVTPLILATRHGNAEMVEALLWHGADPNVADEYGSTPLHYAAALNTSQPTALLIRYGAKGGVENMHGETPMEIVFGNYHRTRDQLTLIVVNDPLPLHRAVEKESLALLTRAIQRLPTRLSQKNRYCETALEMVVRLGKVLAVRVLIEAGMRVDSVNPAGDTLLQIAASVSNATIRRQLIKLISDGLGAQAGPLLHIGTQAVRHHNTSYRGPIPYTPAWSSPPTLQPQQRAMNCPRESTTTNKSTESSKRLLPIALQNALYAGDLFKLKALLDTKTILLRDQFNDTLAIIAARWGETDALRYLISRERPLINATGMDGYTPLHIAAKRGHSKTVKHLLEAGANVSALSMYGADETGRGATAPMQNRTQRREVFPSATPLHFAAREGRLESVQLLLQHGANVTASDWHGRTPLHWAAMMGNLEVVRQLVLHGIRANLSDAVLFARDEDGNMPIHVIARDDYGLSAGILDYLVGVDQRQLVALGGYNNTVLHNIVAENDAATLGRLLAHRPNLESLANYVADPIGTRPSMTPLMTAAIYGHETIVRMLLDAGANDSAIDSAGNRPIHRAAWRGHSNVVDALLDRYPLSVNLKGNHSYTPLHYAIAFEHHDTVQLLLRRGANLSAKAIRGNLPSTARPSVTPLLLAATTGNLPIFRTLLEQGARADQPDSENGSFPIHLAAHSGQIAMVEELLGRDPCQLEWRDFSEQTPLITAIVENRTEVAEYLIAVGANVQARARNPSEPAGGPPSTSALMLAVRNANERIVKSLLLRGADPNPADVNGRTALHHALGLYYQQHARQLIRKMASCIIALLVRHGARAGMENADGLTLTEQAFTINPDREDFSLLVAADSQPLHRAVEKDSVALIRKAVRHLPTRLHQRNSRGETSLEMAVRLGKGPMVQAMLESGLRVDITNADGNTLLHIAANHPNTTIRAQLVEMIAHDAGDDVLPTLLSRRNRTGVSGIDITRLDPIVGRQLHKAIGEWKVSP